MSCSPKRPRTVQKKIRTYTQAFVENNTSFERRRGSTQKQFMRHFHLEQPKQAENAKYQLHEISEGNIQGVELYQEINSGDIGWTQSQTHKWLTEEYKSHNQMKKNKTQSSQRNLNLSEIRKGRTKTSISYKSKQNPQSKNRKDNYISEQVTKIIRQSKQKYNFKNNQKCSFNQVINISPPDLGKTQEFIKCKVNSKQEQKISMTEVKIPTNIQIHNKMIKGPFFPKNKFQRKIVLHKGNTMMLYKKTQEINKKLFLSSHKQSTPRQNLNNTNLQSLLRNSILDLDENRKLKQSEKKYCYPFSKTSPIQEQLQKIKKLITGEQLSYLEISSNCPIKIHRLKGNSNSQQPN